MPSFEDYFCAIGIIGGLSVLPMIAYITVFMMGA